MHLLEAINSTMWVGVNNFPQTEFGRSFVAKVIGTTDNTAKYTQLQNSAHKCNKILNR